MHCFLIFLQKDARRQNKDFGLNAKIYTVIKSNGQAEDIDIVHVVRRSSFIKDDNLRI